MTAISITTNQCIISLNYSYLKKIKERIFGPQDQNQKLLYKTRSFESKNTFIIIIKHEYWDYIIY